MKKTQNKEIRKISHFSAITIIVGAAIGVGIFFKNKELIKLANGNLLLVLLTWIIAAVGIICLAWSLGKISNIKESNRGILGWTSVFTPRWFHKSVANYKKLFFIPIMIFGLSLYVTQSLVKAGLTLNSNFTILLVSFTIFCWLMITNLISLRFSEISQWIMTFMQMIPLVIIPILAFINFGNVGDGSTIWQKEISERPVGLAGVSKMMVLILGLPSVLFSFGGFHSIATQRDNLQKPQKLGQALVIGTVVIIITYLFLTIAFNVGSSDGTHEQINMPIWAKSIFEICIAAGIMSIINGLLISVLTQWRNMMLENESNDLKKLHQVIFKKSPQVSSIKQQSWTIWIFFLAIITLFYLVFGMIGIYVFNNPKGSVGNGLYEIANILTNYMGLVILSIISTTVLGALIRAKRLKDSEIDFKFKIIAIIAITLFYVSLIFTMIGAIVDLTGFQGADSASNTIKMIVFLLTIGLSVLLGIINIFRENRQQNKREIIAMGTE